MNRADSIAYYKKIEKYAREYYINELDHDPCDDGLESFVSGFIEGVFAREEGAI